MTTRKNTAAKLARLGRVRVCDDSMKGAGIRKGDVLRVKLGARPRQNSLCLAFTATGHLVVRRFYRLPNRYIQLTRDPIGKKIQVFAPRAVVIFGAVEGVEKGAV